VVLLGCVNQVEHVCADEDGTKSLEVAMVLVLDFGNAPGVLSALDGATITSLDILLRTDDGEGHGSDQATGVLETRLIILLEWGLVDLNTLCVNNGAYLGILVETHCERLESQRTLCLNLARSCGLKVSAFATTGIRLTLVHRRFMTSMSKGFRVWPVGRIK
jgi:hypothetical protein